MGGKDGSFVQTPKSLPQYAGEEVTDEVCNCFDMPFSAFFGYIKEGLA
jgi:hypothetical protein